MGEKDGLTLLFQYQADGCLVGGKRATKLLARVVGIRAAERNRRANKSRRFSGSFGEMAAQPAIAGKGLPLHRGIGALENRKDAIFFLENALHCGRGEHKEILKLTQMQQAHYGIDVS